MTVKNVRIPDKGVNFVTGSAIPVIGFESDLDWSEKRKKAQEIAVVNNQVCRMYDEHGVLIDVNPWNENFPGIDQVLKPYQP